jgi:hypothetical protein
MIVTALSQWESLREFFFLLLFKNIKNSPKEPSGIMLTILYNIYLVL